VSASGVLMVITGLWLISQVLFGGMLDRLGLFEGL